MIAIKRLAGLVLCGAVLVALPVARAQEDAESLKGTIRELEEKVVRLEEERDGFECKADELRIILVSFKC